uniref:Uncharacterized protein n=2 Tax=Oryza TaxID=4527 RepID=Q6ZLP7_ORYSJ|nr:hypothetical protein [Oryza sativa Japonica Group]
MPIIGRFGLSSAQKNAYCSSTSPQQRRHANTLLRRFRDKIIQTWRHEETREMILNVSAMLGLVAVVAVVGCIMKPHFEAQLEKLAQAFVLLFLLALLQAMVEMQKERRQKSLEDDHADDSEESKKKLKPTKT